MKEIHTPPSVLHVTVADYEGQVAYNVKILKGRVKRGPGKGQLVFQTLNRFDIEAFTKEWNKTRNKAFPMAMTVTDKGLGIVQDLAESLRPQALTTEKMNAPRSPGRVLTDAEFLVVGEVTTVMDLPTGIHHMRGLNFKKED